MFEPTIGTFVATIFGVFGVAGVINGIYSVYLDDLLIGAISIFVTYYILTIGAIL